MYRPVEMRFISMLLKLNVEWRKFTETFPSTGKIVRAGEWPPVLEVQKLNDPSIALGKTWLGVKKC